MNKRTPWSIAAMGLYKMRSQWAIPTSLGVCLTHHCNIRCTYCHAGGTLILTSDLLWKPIEDIKIGDELIGVGHKHQEGTKRQFVSCKVTNTFHREAETVKIITERGETVCTPDHKWMEYHTEHQYRETCRYKPGQYLKFVSEPTTFNETPEYRTGWVAGMIQGDGCLQSFQRKDKGWIVYFFRLAVKDHEILERFKEYLPHSEFNEYDFKTKSRSNMKSLQSTKRQTYEKMKDLSSTWSTEIDFLKGYLAGIFDAEGSRQRSFIRIFNTDLRIIERIDIALKALGFKYTHEKKIFNDGRKTLYVVRILGGLPEIIRFCATINPAIARKKAIFGQSQCGRAVITEILPSGKREVFNIETTTGNYIAGGMVSKNCMRESFSPPEGVITLKKMKLILSRMPYISGVCIMGLCEPYMNPETSAILRWLKDEGKYSISFTTNCTIPFNLSKMDALRRVDDMAISIDTSNPETFRKLRGADLRKVMAHLIHLITYKRNLRLTAEDRPPIHINAVITKDNFEEIPGLIEMLEPYAQDLTYLMLDPCTRPDFSKADTFILSEKPDDFDYYRELAKKSPLKIMGFDWMFEKSRDWSGCQISWLGPFIQPNGDMYPCYGYTYVLGNVFRESPLRVWNSPMARAFRKRLKTDKPPLRQCEVCNFARPKWQPGGSYYTAKEDQG